MRAEGLTGLGSKVSSNLSQSGIARRTSPKKFHSRLRYLAHIPLQKDRVVLV